jgi:hypothetical protein
MKKVWLTLFVLVLLCELSAAGFSAFGASSADGRGQPYHF